MGNAFLALADRGKTRWWVYLLGLLVVGLFWALGSGVVFSIVYGSEMLKGVAVQPMDGSRPYRDFIALNLLFITVLIGLWVAVRYIHRRPFLTLITPYQNLRLGRMLQGFGLYFIFAALGAALEALFFPGTYDITFDPERFFIFAVLIILLTPFQTTTEELLIRGYLLQAIGHFTRHPIVLIALNGLIFLLPHLYNPEIAHGLWPMMCFYFAVGAFMTLLALRDNGLELAIGMHAANNMFAAIFVNYENSALQTSALFTATEINPWFGLFSYLIMAAILYYLLFRNAAAMPQAEMASSAETHDEPLTTEGEHKP